MRTIIVSHIRFLFQTSPQIEALPLYRRPRFLAAVIGGLVVCKFGVMLTVSPEAGLSLLPFTVLGGALATALRYRAWQGRKRVAAPRGVAPVSVVTAFRV